MIERAVILSDNEMIDVNAIILNQGVGLKSAPVKVPFRADIDHDQPFELMMAAYENEIITHVLKRAKSIRKAAKILKLSHTALLNKMKKYQLSSSMLFMATLAESMRFIAPVKCSRGGQVRFARFPGEI